MSPAKKKGLVEHLKAAGQGLLVDFLTLCGFLVAIYLAERLGDKLFASELLFNRFPKVYLVQIADLATFTTFVVRACKRIWQSD